MDLFDVVPATPEVPSGVASFSPCFQKILIQKGLITPEAIEAFFHPSLENLPAPSRMKGLMAIAERILKASEKGEKIFIHGDYDVDGITSTVIMAKTLSELRVPFEMFVPTRADDGYGVSSRAIKLAKEKDAAILLTVDCGSSAHEEIDAAKKEGLEVLVIDHHQVSSKGLPNADILVNPCQKECEYPFDGLSAAGLVLKLSFVLLGDRARSYLDLAALSTVCDVSPLVEENRVLVKKGLEKMAASEHCGLRALMDTAGILGKEINAGHLGFVLGPRINAAGRMSHPEVGLQLFMTEDVREAYRLSRILEEENKMRQKEERQMLQEAIAEVERTVNFSRDRVIVVGRKNWHPGVIGIVASRLVDRYHRPAIVISFEGEEARGSARAIKGFDIHQAIHACGEVLEAYGGHAQAAGVNLKTQHFPEFRTRINQYAAPLSGEIFERHILHDLEVSLPEISAVLVEELKLLEPHGMGNPRPVFFTKDLVIRTSPKWITPQILKFQVEGDGRLQEAVWIQKFNDMDLSWLRPGTRIHMAYSVKTRVWNGLESLQLEVKEIKPQL